MAESMLRLRSLEGFSWQAGAERGARSDEEREERFAEVFWLLLESSCRPHENDFEQLRSCTRLWLLLSSDIL